MLASGNGSTLQALLAAQMRPGYPAAVVAVGTDRPGTRAQQRAEAASVPTFRCQVGDYSSRAAWDVALAEYVASYEPDLVVSAGFMKLAGASFLARFERQFLNTHPSLLPAFPGMNAPADALAYGVKVSGCSLFLVDAGVDTGPLVAQATVEVLDDDDVTTLHERIKERERDLLVDTVARMTTQGWTVHDRRVTIP